MRTSTIVLQVAAKGLTLSPEADYTLTWQGVILVASSIIWYTTLY